MAYFHFWSIQNVSCFILSITYNVTKIRKQLLRITLVDKAKIEWNKLKDQVEEKEAISQSSYSIDIPSKP